MTFWKTFWASLLALVIPAIIFIFILFAVIGSFSPNPNLPKRETVLHLKLDYGIGDISYSYLDKTAFQPVEQIGLVDILNAIKKAKKDSKIKGIFLNINNLNTGMATIKEIRNALDDFKSSGKFIMAYAESYTNKSYYLSSVANEVYMYPTGLFGFVGLGVEIPFLKEALDKLEVEMQIIRGSNNKFKSAVEPLMYNQMSEANRLQTKKYIDALWSEILLAVKKNRGIEINELNRIADGILTRTPQDAAKFNFIDGTKYYDEIESLLKTRLEMDQGDDLNFFSFKEYVNLHTASKRKAPIAVVSLEGDIVDGNGEPGQIGGNSSAELIRKVRKDSTIKAVVLRVNSPGGSALASDLIWREVELTKVIKPVIVSMGDVAASGGYYVSCGAHKIFAEPNTITGSIGVFGVIPYTGNMLKNKLGISFDRVETNTHSTLSLNKRLTEEEIDIVQEGVDLIYDDFISKVAEGRGLTKAEVDSIGQGRVWAGKDAKAIGLIDEFGGLTEAITAAAEELDIEENKIKVKVYSTTETDPMIELMKSFDQVKASSDQLLQKRLMELYQFVERIENSKGVQARMPYLFWIE